jgi:deoxyribodipyrimidine photo-lyase
MSGRNYLLTNYSCDLPFDDVNDLPNIYTSFRKSLEPLRERPRQTLPSPTLLPPLPPDTPPQKYPFEIPTSLEALHKALQAPFEEDIRLGIGPPTRLPPDTISAHPFEGGEKAALDRLSHLVSSGAMSSYKDTRNGMVGLDFSTKLSAYLAHGNLTARQVHWAMVDFEEGHGEGQDIPDYGKGENKGTAAVRFELLWRDYMRLCARKFGAAMFDINGIRDAEYNHKDRQHPERKRWRYIDGTGDGPTKTREVYARFIAGQTGMGLIDASNRELVATGYTSNRARQNVASFLASHLEIDWRIGAEWYEYLLTDYDVGSNWGNWQYVAGVGNDPRQGRVFNPVKQALDYDKQGKYIKAWVPELRGVALTKSVGPSKGQGKEDIDSQRLMGLYQAWKLGDWEKSRLGLKGLEWVENPLVRIQFSVGRGRGAGAEGDTRGRGKGRGTWRGRDQGFRRTGPEDKAANRE